MEGMPHDLTAQMRIAPWEALQVEAPRRARRTAGGSHSSANHLQIGLSPPRAQRQDFRFAPAVARGQDMNLHQHSAGPRMNLAPQKRCNVERRLPLVSTESACQRQTYVA